MPLVKLSDGSGLNSDVIFRILPHGNHSKIEFANGLVVEYKTDSKSLTEEFIKAQTDPNHQVQIEP
ncbi:hypothetical protein [Terriglobus albidus]|uniref:hypothetical protein n=1 Tax=Terriglobus albidus TaxID=1592106 RepID=UPI0021E089E6|nr:hypothetical protein [Terriglobus albidus]